MPDFPEIDFSLLDPFLWTTVVSMLWHILEDMLVGEARALLERSECECFCASSSCLSPFDAC